MNRLGRIAICGLLLVAGSFAADQPQRKLVRQQEAEYPVIASKMNLHGTVKLKVWISPDGTIHRLEYIGGHPLLAESALKAVKNWKYETAASESTSQVEIKF